MELVDFNLDYKKNIHILNKEILDTKLAIKNNRKKIIDIKDEIYHFKKEVTWTIKSVKNETKQEIKLIKSEKTISLRDKQKEINKKEVLQMQSLFFLKNKQTEKLTILYEKIEQIKFENDNLKVKIMQIKKDIDDLKEEIKKIHLARLNDKQYNETLTRFKEVKSNVNKEKRIFKKLNREKINDLFETFEKNNSDIKYPRFQIFKMNLLQLKPFKNDKEEKLYELLVEYNKIKSEQKFVIEQSKENIKAFSKRIDLKYANFNIKKISLNFWENTIFRTYKFTNSTFISSLRSGYFSLIPFILIGAFAIFFNNIILNDKEGSWLSLFHLSKGFHNVIKNLDVFGEVLYKSTYGIISVLLCITVSISLSNYYKINKLVATCTTLACFIVMIPNFATDFDLLGTKGLFMAIIVSMSVVFLYNKLRNLNRFATMRFIAINKTITKAIEPMILIIVLILIYATISSCVYLIGREIGLIQIGELKPIIINNMFDVIEVIIQKIFSVLRNNIFNTFIVIIIWQFFWFIGVRSSDIINPAIEHVNDSFGSVSVESIYNPSFLSHGISDGIMALLILIILFSKRKEWKFVALISFIPVFFNINEPILFGLPIILNPIFFFSFLIAPIIGAGIGYFAMYYNIVQSFDEQVLNSNFPVFIGSIITTKSVLGLFISIIIVLLQMLIYFPVIKISNKNIDKELIYKANIDKERLKKLNKKIDSYLT
ncbi:PTS transporter subunit EIIC [Spiroplasma endosymbiont of Crioceris asparagi]|uniref:PTS transporter subunit EIIC n=1 Tax=Spiroplasma endosymbiont of Crioceris asparagi TaxID=3066286 RepID=UPI0030CCEC5C